MTSRLDIRKDVVYRLGVHSALVHSQLEPNTADFEGKHPREWRKNYGDIGEDDIDQIDSCLADTDERHVSPNWLG